jgi:hypothetical protein
MNKELTQCEWVSTVNSDRCDNHGGHPRICTAVITDLNAELRRQSQELERAREIVEVAKRAREYWLSAQGGCSQCDASVGFMCPECAIMNGFIIALRAYDATLTQPAPEKP